jgi:hypothetical protein
MKGSVYFPVWADGRVWVRWPYALRDKAVKDLDAYHPNWRQEGVEVREYEVSQEDGKLTLLPAQAE